MSFKKKYAKFPNPKFIQLVKQLFETEPVSLFASLTLAEMNILVAANGLQTGMQYKVTDKNWNLVATSPNTVKPLVGVIIVILNGETFPVWLETDVFYVDSGLITSDISNTPMVITGKSGYFVENIVVKNNGDNYMSQVKLKDSSDVQLFRSTSAIMKNLTAVLLTDGTSSSAGMYIINPNSATYSLYASFAGTISARIILKFQKSLFN
jgi:hypothetical protein